jgi:putative tryptophan/tyrosine transport system substrate-binding protein
MNITEAQTTTINQIGILSPMDANGENDVWDAFKDGLTELGYSEGKGVTFVSRFAEGNYDRLPAFAADLVQLGVDVIVPATPPAIKAAKSATSTIPIVFPVGSDPVELGLVSSYDRPGGNVTGVATMSWKLSHPRLALLNELMPTARKVALIRHSANVALDLQVRETRTAASQLGIDLLISAQELEGAFGAAKQQGASAMMTLSDPMAANNSDRIASLSFKYRIPVVSPYMHMAKAGAVLAYGPNRALLYRRAASLVARVLREPRRPAHRAAQSIRHGDQHEVGAKLWFASSRCLARTCNARRSLDQAELEVYFR